MADWWDSYITDTPSYLDPNLTSSSGNWWDTVEPYQDFTTAPIQGINDYSWLYSPQYGDSVINQNWAAPASTGNWWDTALNSVANNAGGILGGLLSTGGGLIQGNANQNANASAANQQAAIAQAAANAAKFRPIGITTKFGSSQFGYDANGNLASAAYGISPQLQAQQDKLLGMSNGLLDQYQGTVGATAPMQTAASSMMGLGNSYLQTTPQQQAAKYMAEQQALLAAPRAAQLADINSRLNAQGRMGLAVGGDAGQMAANPELAAYYNALQQQDLGLAAQATQGGMDYAKFGGNMVGQGGNLLRGMFDTQSAAYSPYQTALGGAGYLEGLGQQPLDIGINLGSKGAAFGSNAGQLLQAGMLNSIANRQRADAYSPSSSILAGISDLLSNYQWGT